MHQFDVRVVIGSVQTRSTGPLRRGVSMALIVLAGVGAGCSGDDDDVGDRQPGVVSTPAQSDDPAPPVGTPAELPGVLEYNETDRNHVNEPVTYTLRPPVGGSHSPVWQNCGFYSDPVPEEQAVHALEHGAVWVTYNADLVAEDDLNELAEVAAVQTHVLVTPYDQDAPLILTAWNRQQILETIDGQALADFILEYQQGPQTPEPGAPCEGGVGDPAD